MIARACLAFTGLALTSALWQGPLRAQSSRQPARAAAVATAPRPSVMKGPAVRREAAILTRGQPRSVALLSIPLPLSMPRDRIVSYSVTSFGGMSILGRRQGMLDPRTNPDPQVVISIGVQAAALAGRRTVAEVQFQAAGVDPVVVPVDLEVGALRRITVMATAQLVVVRPGEEARVPFRLTNTGNAVDTVRVRVEAPDGWGVRPEAGLSRIVLDRHESFESFITVLAPRNVTGAAAISVIVEGTDGERGRALTMVEVPLTTARRSRLSFAPSFATVIDQASLTNVAGDFRIWGPLWRSVGVDARWSRLPAAGTPGLSRLGAGVSAPQASLFTDTWRLDMGNAGVSFSELAGINTYGRGASLTRMGGGWSGATLVARPYGDFNVPGQRSRPILTGIRLDRQVGNVGLSTSLTHLDNGLPVGGLLDAIAVGGRSAWGSDGRIRAEAALRRYDGGIGAGLAGEADRRSARGEFRVRLAHAPGGTDAFAYNRSQFSAFGSRAFGTRLRAHGGSWYSDNRSALTRGSQRSSGASISSTIAVGHGMSLGTAANLAGFSLRDSIGGSFGGATRAGSAFASARVGIVTLTGSGTYAVEARSSSVPSIALTPADRHLTLRASAATSLPFAVASLSRWVQRPVGGATFLPGQGETQLTVQDIRIPGVSRVVTFGANLSRLEGYGRGNSVLTQRYDAAAAIPGGVTLRMDIERNPLFADFGRNQWSTALRIERTFDIASPAGGGGGYVYEDRNGDGARNRGEPGLAGVILRSEGQTAVTARDGRYRLDAGTRTPPEVDERSLPFGWVLAPRRGMASRDFAVIPMSSAEVRLAITGDAVNRLASLNLSMASIVANDSADRMWVARVDSAGRGVFESLPPGRYRVVVDLSRIAEPLSVRAELPEIRTSATRETVRMVVPVQARPMRVWRATVPEASPVAVRPGDGPDTSPSVHDTTLRGAPRVTYPVAHASSRRPAIFRATPPRLPRVVSRVSAPAKMAKARPVVRPASVVGSGPASHPHARPEPGVRVLPTDRSLWERFLAWARSSAQSVERGLMAAWDQVRHKVPLLSAGR